MLNNINASETHWLYGQAVALKIMSHVRESISIYQAQGLRPPALGLIRIGDDPASIRYMQKKIKACGEVNIQSHLFTFSEQESSKDLKSKIKALGESKYLDGLLLQLPLPKSVSQNPQEYIDLIPADKDIDGLTSGQQLKLLTNAQDVMIPCTAAGVLALLHYYEINLTGKNVIIIGRSILVGRPLASLLLKENASVTVLHSHSKNIARYLKLADILIVAIGQAQAINPETMRQGAIIIDVGISVSENKKLMGDVFVPNAPSNSYITPVPGGVGPVTVAMLMLNCCRAYALHHHLKLPNYL